MRLTRFGFCSSASCLRSVSSSALFSRVFLPMLGLVLLSATARAATITVTRFDDTAANGPNTGDGLGLGVSGDLRSAILAANAAGGTNIIDFSCASAPCTITLGGPLPPILATATTPGGTGSYNLTIDGGQFGTVIIDGASKYRVFFVDNVAVTLSNLDIQNANATGGAGGLGAGGGGAGFGAGLFVDEATAVVTVSNSYFYNCSVTGGSGGAGVAGSDLSGGGGGGGLGFAGGGDNNNFGVGGGGGVTGPGSMTNGGTGGGGGPGQGTGGSGYANNSAGANGTSNGLGGAGGFGGGGGGSAGQGHGNGGFGGGGSGADISLTAGNGGFGGGGGGSNNGTAGTSPTVGGIAGGGGGAGTGWSNATYGVQEIPDGGGGGGAAAGPAIFVNLGSVTLDNVSGAGFTATGGTGGSGKTAGCCSVTNGGNGTASSVAVFNYGGSVNGSTTVGPIASALPGGAAVPGTTPTSTNFGSVAVGSSFTQPVFFTVASGTVVGSISVLTQGASGLDFTQAADTTCTATTYASATNCTVNVQFSPRYAGLRMGAVVFKNGSGTVLATAYVYGVGSGPQVAFSPPTITTLGSGFSNPVNVAVDGSGNVYVVDTPISAVKEMPAGCASSSCVTTLGGGFFSPFGVAVDGAGNVYVADFGHQAVKEMPPGCASATCVTTLGGSFTDPSDVALDGAGNVYVGDYFAVKEMPPGCASASCVTTLGGGFGEPFDVAVDASGNIYVTDKTKQLLDELSTGCASSACVTPLGNGGLEAPQGVAVDASGNVYVTDIDNTVKKLTPGCASSSCVTTLSGGFNQPSGVALDGSGNIYVANTISSGTVNELNVTTPPSLSFGSSDVGVQSTSSPQTATVRNIGNAALTFPVPGTGIDPSVAANFALDASTTCPEVTTSSSAGILAAGSTCNLAVDFIPTSGTSITGSVVLTDNNLNVAGATQSIGLSGTGVATTVQVSVGTNLPGVAFTVDGVTYTSTQSFTWHVGDKHTLGVPTKSLELNGISYDDNDGIWSDGNLSPDTITVSAGTTSYTTTFYIYAYEFSATAAPGGALGATTVANNYYPTGSQETISAVPNAGYYFVNWTGAASPGDIASATSANTYVTMNGPEYLTANFAPIPGYVVTTTADDATGAATNCPGTGTSCTLRDAITAANVAGAGTITFSPTVFKSTNTTTQNIITLLTSLPALNGQITITGLGANLITVSGNKSATVGSIFVVNSGAVVVISGLTIANGNAGQNSSTGSNGGGIDSAGALTVTNSVLSGNVGWNTGGGIFTSGGSLTVRNTTFSGNSATIADGGAIFTSPPTTTANVSYSTFYQNTRGAIAAFSPLAVSSSTFSANQGGAISFNTTGTVVNSIFSINSAAGSGAGILGAVSASYNLYYNNLDNGTTEDDCNGCSSNTNSASGNPNLAPLGNYGGPTPTMIPLPASAAICAASSALIPNGVTTDQRGDPDSTTYNSTKCYDLGAVQTNYSLVFSTEPGPISPATSILTSTNFEAGVELEENGVPFIGPAVTIPLTLSAGTGTLTGNSANTSPTTGIASYNTLTVSATGTGDTLTANLALNPAATTPPTVAVTSNPFTVSPPLVATSVVVSGYPSPVYVGVAHTGTVSVNDQNGNLLATYSGSATITTSDTAAKVTTPVTITNGTGTFSVTFAATGPQSITAAINGLTSVSQIGIQVNPTAGYVVTTPADDATGVSTNCPGTSCTLRDAITAANAAGAGNITFSPTVFKSTNTASQNTITLTSSLPALTGLITIQGLGANIVTVSGNNAAAVGSIFTVNYTATVVISGLTITNGNAITSVNGGGIDSAGALTVASCAFSGNTAVAGGAINIEAGSLAVQNSTFSSNSATNAGGGAIYAGGDSANVSYSTFYNNTTKGNGSGGAIVAFTPLTVSDSTFTSNSASQSGGAIANGTSSPVVNSIFSGNSAPVGAGIAGYGASAGSNLFYQNYDTGTTTEDDCNGCTSNTNPISGNPNLAPLGNYGGPAPTMIPLPASPAICAASSALIPNGLTTDQRGDPNSTTYSGNKCYDVGAVQTNYSLLFSTEPGPISPGTSILTSTNFDAAVTLDESGAPFIGPAVTIPLTLSAGTGTLTGNSASTSTTTGIASYSTLQVNTTGAADTLTATLALNPAATTPPTVAVTSNPFAVNPASVQVSVGTNFAGLSFTVDTTTSTTTLSTAWSVPSQHTIATTSPQYLDGIQLVWSNWSDGGAISHQVTASAGTTSYAASFQPNAYELTVTAGAGGALSPATAAESGTYFASGADPTITAIPNAGYYFVNWTGAGLPGILGSATSVSTTVEIVEPESLTANFLPIPGYVVTSAADDATGNAANCPGTGTSCTLRDAITAANAAGAGTITFSPTVFKSTNTTTQNTITLLTPLPALNGQITITGLGANIITVSGNKSSTVGSIFTVNAGATVVISGLTITDGNANAGGAGNGGGGIHNSGTLTVSGSVLSNNTAINQGGGIYSNSGMLTITDSTFAGNQTTDAGGAGIYAYNTSLTVSYSTFSGNSSAYNGGGILVDNGLGVTTVSNSTFSGNTANGIGEGGGIAALNGSPLTATNNIFILNYSNAVGAAILGSSGVNASNNLYSRNFDQGSPVEDDCNGCNSNANPISGNPNLAPLGNYGGPAPTMIPLPASAAICAASSALIPNGVTTDQRGDPNSTTYSGNKCYDVGAVQTNYSLSFTTNPPATGTAPGVAMSPAPIVTVEESGAPLTGGQASVSVTDTKSDLTTTPATANSSITNGQATFSSLLFTAPESTDSLTATLVLNPGNTALNLTATSTSFSVGMITPTVTAWPSATAISYGQPLASSVLSGGVASVSGSFAFTNPTAVLGAGLQSVSVTFTPMNQAGYSTVLSNVSAQVNKTTPTIVTLPTASAINYGQPLPASTLTGGSAISLVAVGTPVVPGTFVFTNPITFPPPGLQSESVTFTPMDRTDYNSVSGNVNVQVNKTNSIVTTWPTASAITFGQTLASSTLSGGASSVPGKFTFSSAVTIPPVGTNPQSVTFTPNNAADYSPVTGNVSVTVNKATPSVTTWPTASAITYGQTLASSTLSGGVASVQGKFAFTYPANAPSAGTNPQSVTFTPNDNADYSSVTSTASVQVNQASPAIIWPTPASIPYGTLLSSTQLDATSTVAGTFLYSPAAGTLLPTGTNQTLKVTLTPLSSNYATVSATVLITVTPGPLAHLSTYSINFGSVYQGNSVSQTVTVFNVGTAAMTIGTPTISAIAGGSASEFSITNSCPKSLAAGNSCNITVTFTASGASYNPQTADLNINDNSPGAPQTIPIYAQAGDAVAKISTGSLSFGTVKVGTSSAPQSVILKNTGGTPLTSSIGISGANPGDFSETDNCAAPLAPNASCTIEVTFAPTAKKSRSATLMITSNAQSSLETVALSGTGD